jgi:hypothetical protein
MGSKARYPFCHQGYERQVSKKDDEEMKDE